MPCEPAGTKKLLRGARIVDDSRTPDVEAVQARRVDFKRTRARIEHRAVHFNAGGIELKSWVAAIANPTSVVLIFVGGASLIAAVAFATIRSRLQSQTTMQKKSKWKSCEIIADRLSAAGWSWGCVSTIHSNGQTIFIADAHRRDGKRFVVPADEKLNLFLELERVTRE
jgi:hypothetical protein